MNELIICLMVAQQNIIGHWFPWAVCPPLADEQGRLRRVAAYVHGTGTIVLGFLCWTLMQRASTILVWEAWWMLCKLVVAAAVGTLLPRGVERFLELGWLKGDNKDYEQAIQSQRPEA